jgi:hypothetical protein
MKTMMVLFSALLSISTFAQEIQTVEITPEPQTRIQSETQTTSVNAKDYYRSSYNSNWEMREHRKLGAGVGMAGIFGQIGGVADINFDAQNAAHVGFGTGRSFSTFFMAWKNSFESKYVSPYITVGYSRWYNSDNSDLRGNSYILDQVLSSDELSKGKIGVDFLMANVGVQFNQLDSDWIGNSFFLEFDFLYSTSRSTLIPAASVGSIYYF